MYKINQRTRLGQKQDKLQNRFIHLSTGLVRANTEDNRAHDNTAQPRLASAFPAEDHGGTGTTARRSPSSNTTTCSRPHARHPRPLLCTWQGRRGFSKARALEETSPSKRFNTSNNFQHTDFSRFFAISLCNIRKQHIRKLFHGVFWGVWNVFAAFPPPQRPSLRCLQTARCSV